MKIHTFLSSTKARANDQRSDKFFCANSERFLRAKAGTFWHILRTSKHQTFLNININKFLMKKRWKHKHFFSSEINKYRFWIVYTGEFRSTRKTCEKKVAQKFHPWGRNESSHIPTSRHAVAYSVEFLFFDFDSRVWRLRFEAEPAGRLTIIRSISDCYFHSNVFGYITSARITDFDNDASIMLVPGSCSRSQLHACIKSWVLIAYSHTQLQCFHIELIARILSSYASI